MSVPLWPVRTHLAPLSRVPESMQVGTCGQAESSGELADAGPSTLGVQNHKATKVVSPIVDRALLPLLP